MTFLWGLLNQRARVVGLSWRLPVDFSRHVGIISVITDTMKVHKSKVEWSDKDPENSPWVHYCQCEDTL